MTAPSPIAVAQQLAAGMTAAWNSHDMRAFAQLFHADAAFVNVAGKYVRGAREIERLHAAGHAGPFRDSTIAMSAADAVALSETIVLAHLASALAGDARAGGQVRHTLMTAVIERRRELWKCTAAHNTNVVEPAR